MHEHRKLTIKRIMVATDFSDASHGALNYAKQLARCFSAKVLVVHVVDTERTSSRPEVKTILSDQIDSAEDELQKIHSALSFDNVNNATIVRPGSIREVILNLIAERDIDLLVIGTRGAGRKEDEDLGSVAEMLLRAMPCPVLTVGRGAHQDACEGTHTRTILFPTDFSEMPRKALTYAENLTTHLAGRLLLLHVDENRAAAGASHSAEFQMLMHEMDNPSIVAEQITCIGRPADLIVKMSVEKCADFIVAGVNGSDQAGKAHDCEIAFDVIRSAKCPVFTLIAQAKKDVTKAPETEADEFHHQQERLSFHHS